MPGARAMGKLPPMPIRKHPMRELAAVAVIRLLLVKACLTYTEATELENYLEVIAS